ncbi:hypothetical protein [Streptomyces sp. NPDC058657]|uniref:hypothetical protein n=1 Tax=unclassified Streptomyces TaxID=2593676 RepID=UPI003657DDCE
METQGNDNESVSKAPGAAAGGKVLLATHSRKGNATLPLKGGARTDLLSVQFNCQGKGGGTVSVEPIGMEFPVTCVEHQVNSTYHEIRLKRPRAEAEIRVTAPSTVRWALTAEQ